MDLPGVPLMEDPPRTKRSVTITRWGYTNKLDTLWEATYKGITYKIYPKTAIYVISLFGLGMWINSRIRRRDTIDKISRDITNEYNTEIKKMVEKTRKDTIRDICGDVDPNVVKKWIDTISHLEERKNRKAADLKFSKNEAKYKALFEE